MDQFQNTLHRFFRYHLDGLLDIPEKVGRAGILLLDAGCFAQFHPQRSLELRKTAETQLFAEPDHRRRGDKQFVGQFGDLQPGYLFVVAYAVGEDLVVRPVQLGRVFRNTGKKIHGFLQAESFACGIRCRCEKSFRK